MAIPGRYRIFNFDTLTEAEASVYFDNNQLAYINGVLHFKEDDYVKPIEVIVGSYPFSDFNINEKTIYIDVDDFIIYRYISGVLTALNFKTDSDNVVNQSDVEGDSVTDALDQLEEDISSFKNFYSTPVSMYNSYINTLLTPIQIKGTVVAGEEKIFLIPLSGNYDAIVSDTQANFLESVTITPSQSIGGDDVDTVAFSGYQGLSLASGTYEVSLRFDKLDTTIYGTNPGSEKITIDICSTNGADSGELFEEDNIFATLTLDLPDTGQYSYGENITIKGLFSIDDTQDIDYIVPIIKLSSTMVAATFTMTGIYLNFNKLL